MAQEDVRLSGAFLDSAGNALADKTVTLFAEGTITPALATDTTDSSGEWDFTRTTPGRYDVQLVSGTQTYRVLARDKFQVSELTTRNPTTAQPALSAYSTTSEASSLVATFGFRPATESSGVETGDAPSDGDLGYIDFTLSNDHASRQEWITGRIAWEAADVTATEEDGQFNFWTMTAGTLVEELHLSGAALWPETDAGLDLGTSALGFNDLHLGSGGVVNFDGGDLTLTHSSGLLTVSGGLTVSGATTLNGNVTLGSAADDVITVNGTVAGANAMVFEGATGNLHETTLNVTDPTADATIKLPAMGAGTYFLPVLDTLTTTAISSTPEELNILDGATVVVAEVNYLDLGATAVGTAIASKAVVLDSSKDYTGINNLTVAGELDAATLDLSSSADIAGDLVLSGGADGALQFTNAGENSIKIPDNQASALIIEEANNAYLIFDTANSSESVSIGTGISGTAITLGHSTSEVTVADNLTVTGDLTVSGTTTTVDTTNTVVTDNLLELNSGATSNANDSGIIIERGSTGNNAILMWDESADVFTVGTTTATADSTGNLANFAAAPFTAAAINGTVITASSNFAGALTGNVTGNASGTAATVTAGTQAAITTLANVVEVGTIGTGVWQGTPIATAYIADNAITLDKLASGTDGNIISYDTSGNPVAVATGDDGQVLTSAGADAVPTFEDLPSTSATALDDVATGDAAANLVTTVGNITIDAQANDADVIIKVDDAGSAVTAVTFDGSDEGNAIFVNDVQLKSDGALLEFGADLDTTLTHTDGTGLTLNSTNKLTFGDAASFIQQSSDGTLRIDGEAIIDLNASTKVDVSATLNTVNLTVGGAQGSDGQVLTSTGSGVGWEAIPAATGTASIASGTYSGNGSATNAITGLGLTPKFIMIMPRVTGAGTTDMRTSFTSFQDNNAAGLSKREDLTTVTVGGIKSFDTGGFTVSNSNDGWNESGQDYDYVVIGDLD